MPTISPILSGWPSRLSRAPSLLRFEAVAFWKKGFPSASIPQTLTGISVGSRDSGLFSIGMASSYRQAYISAKAKGDSTSGAVEGGPLQFSIGNQLDSFPPQQVFYGSRG